MRALIVIDVQKGFINHPVYENLCKKLNKYLSTNEGKYDYIFFTKFVNGKGSLYETKLNWTNLQDESSQEFAINVPDNAIIFEKNTYGLNVCDIEKIKNLGIDEIDVCGLHTDACVYAISFELFDNGIYPNILFNYCATNVIDSDQIKYVLENQFGSVDERK